jgi:hypothetical protein
MQAWKFMQGPPFDQPSATMRQCREGISNSDRSVAYLEHRVRADAELALPIELGPTWKFNRNLRRELILQALRIPVMIISPQGSVFGQNKKLPG